MPNGVMIYHDHECKLDEISAPKIPRVEVIDEVYSAVINGKAPRHNGEWAMATLEICLGMIRSSREGREIELKYQSVK